MYNFKIDNKPPGANSRIYGNRGYGRMKEVTTMSRSYDLEIWCVWLPGCVNVGVKKLSYNISENTDV